MKKRTRTRTRIMIVRLQLANVLFAALLISSCASVQLVEPTLIPTPTNTFTPTATVTPTITPTVTLIPTLTAEESIQDILEIACQGKPATSPDVGTSTEQPGVRLCNDSSEFLLPDNWKATTPETLRYVVAVSSTQVQSGSCTYSSTGGINTTIQLSKPIETILIYDSVTGALIAQREVQGSVSRCPEYVFNTTPKNDDGFSPSQDAMQDAMMDLLSPLLPSPKFIPTATPIPVPLCSPSFTLNTTNTSEVNGFVFSRDGTLLGARFNDGMVKLWDVTSGREIITIDDWAYAFHFSPDGKIFAVLLEDYSVQLWDVTSGSEISTLDTSELSDLIGFDFLPDGRLVTLGALGVKFWDAASGNEVASIDPGGIIRNGLVSADGKLLVVAQDSAAGYAVDLWDVESGREVRTLLESKSELGFVFSHDSKLLVTWSLEGSTLTFWDVASGREVRNLELEGEHYYVDFLPDNKTLISMSRIGLLQLWDEASGREVTPPGGEINDFDFSADGSVLAFVAYVTEDSFAKLWDVTSGSEVRTLDINDVRSVVVSPNGMLVASQSQHDAWDDFVIVWEVDSGNRVCEPEGKRFSAFSFSPDETLLVSGTSDGIVKLWEVSR